MFLARMQSDARKIPEHPLLIDRKPHDVGLMLLAIAAQFSAILLTWPIWTRRESPLALPLLAASFWDALLSPLPTDTVGSLMLTSLLLCVVWPRWGGWLQGLLLLAACAADQYRFQPQFLFVSVGILAFSRPYRVPWVRWLFISMWLWAGLHKVLSPEWFGIRSFSLFSSLSPSAQSWHVHGAWGIALMEILLGGMAWLRPRLAAFSCVPLHMGIAVFLSPLGINYNASVIPWNLFLAVAGFLLFYNSDNVESIRKPVPARSALPVLLLLYPAGFYLGWIDHSLAFVLYSGGLPEARITEPGIKVPQSSSRQSSHGIIRTPEHWGVPFPYEQRTLLTYFERNAHTGAKLHIHDPRPFLEDCFFLKTESGVLTISEERFLRSSATEPTGEYRRDLADSFQLVARKHQLYRRWEGGPIYAIQFNSSTFQSEDLDLLRGLPGLEQLQLRNCNIRQQDLSRLPQLLNLRAIDVHNTSLTVRSLVVLQSFPRLKTVLASPEQISANEIIKAGFSPGVESLRNGQNFDVR